MTDFPAGRWRARWIRWEPPAISFRGFEAEVSATASHACVGWLRRRVVLARVPDRAPVRITADGRYVLFVNGSEVMRGPVRAGGRRLHVDTIDLAPWLRSGTNAVVVLAHWPGRATPWWAPATPGLQLGAGAVVLEARLDDELLVSDASWRGRACEAWSRPTPRGVGGMSSECVDARALPVGVTEAEFDDTDWPHAALLTANHVGFGGRHEPPSHPFGAMRPRPLPLLGGAMRVAHAIDVAHGPATDLVEDPVSQVQQDAAIAGPLQPIATQHDSALRLDAGPDRVSLVTLDFGEVVAGTLALEIDAPAGARIDLVAAERRDADGRLDLDDPQNGLRYVARGTKDSFESLDPIGLRYARLAIRAKAAVTLHRVAVRERLHPRGEGPFFECSDERLNAIHRAGRRTVDLCSQDAYLDCPTREQRAWTGDAVVHQMVDLATNANWSLARWNVELAAAPRSDGMLPMAVAGDIEAGDATFIPDWALHWVRSLHNLWRWTGEREVVQRLLPVAERVLRWFEPFDADDGLATDVTGWVIVDWSSVSVAGKSSVLNALRARALRDFAEMSEWVGDAGRARWARDAWARISRAFERFWDAERCVYVDHATGDRRERPVSQHSLATPLAAGLVPPDRVARVIDTMLDESRLVHATWSRASGDARHPAPSERGLAGPYLVLGPPPPWWDVERQIVRAQPFYRYVVHDALAEHGRADLLPSLCLDWMALLERCPTTLSETWYGGTTCHAWCATPTRDLVTRTLGVTPAEPGFARALVAPRLGPLAFARGAVPTPHGLLRVDVTQRRVCIESPVPLEVDLPGRARTRHGAGRVEIAPPRSGAQAPDG